MMRDAIVWSPRRSDADDGAAEVDAETVLDNVVELDRLLDDTSRREVDSLPVLELSKHMRVRSSVTVAKSETETLLVVAKPEAETVVAKPEAG